MAFESDDEHEEYIVNKKAKTRILDFILKEKKQLDSKAISLNEFEIILEKSIKVLQENTGCAEDLEILEEILDALCNIKIINSQQYSDIVKGTSSGRWL